MNNNQNKISISALNVKGLRGNFNYSKYLSSISNIVFLCELWTRPNEVDLIKDISNNSNIALSKNFLYKSDMDHTYTKGRPFGGQCWLIDKKFKLVEHRFVSKHLSYIHFKDQSFEQVIIGVYMPFSDSKKFNESKSMFELSLTLISTISEEFKSRNIPVSLAGDFNADLNRSNRFDKILKKFVKDHGFYVVDNLNNKNPPTFKSPLINNSYNVANLDHFIFCKSHIPSSFISPSFSVLDDSTNVSDHKAIMMSFYVENNQQSQSNKNKSPPKKLLKLDDPIIGEFFASQVDARFCSIFESTIRSNFKIDPLDQEQINLLYEKISHVYAEASEMTFKFQESFCNNNNNNSLNLNGNYESAEIKSIKKNLRKSYGKLKNSPKNTELKKEYEKLKKDLRRCERREIYLKELSELYRLERVAKLKNKNGFWRFTKKLKNKRTVVKEVTASSEKLFNHYKSFFMDDQSNLNEKQQNITKKVNDFFGAYTKPQNFPFFTMDQLDNALNETDNSPVKGYDSISYQLIKKSISSTSKEIILFLYNSMLFSSKVPTKLNVSIIKPILKDPEKRTDDLNNIRPISISTCFAQIFERLIIIRSPKLKITHNNQFGFKQKTSCNHALFTLKETILNYTENRTGIKIASLDAEKAFDKVWRNGLFFKLIERLDYTMWYILKIYYDSSQGTIALDDGFLSELFPITVGVKQGGILSPDLFKVFIDELIHNCTEKNVGAMFNLCKLCNLYLKNVPIWNLKM